MTVAGIFIVWILASFPLGTLVGRAMRFCGRNDTPARRGINRGLIR